MKEDNEKVKQLFKAYACEEGASLYINEMIEQMTMIKDDILIFYRSASRDVSPYFGMMAPLHFEEDFHLFIRKKTLPVLESLFSWSKELKIVYSTENAQILADDKQPSIQLARAFNNDFEFKTLLDGHLHQYHIDIDQNDLTVYRQKGMVTLLEETTMTVEDLKEMMLLLKKTREALIFAYKHRY